MIQETAWKSTIYFFFGLGLEMVLITNRIKVIVADMQAAEANAQMQEDPDFAAGVGSPLPATVPCLEDRHFCMCQANFPQVSKLAPSDYIYISSYMFKAPTPCNKNV